MVQGGSPNRLCSETAWKSVRQRKGEATSLRIRGTVLYHWPGPGGSEIVCFCENISYGEILDALDSPLQPRTLDALKRRTRVLTGRCQGFDCCVPVAEIMASHLKVPIESITKNGPGSELVVGARHAGSLP